MEWVNVTSIEDFENRLDKLMGFIYEIKLTDGRYYIGRKQFKTSRGYDTGWRNYNSTSKTIKENLELIASKEIMGIFSSKSAMRYAETACILWSDSYLNEKGLNWSFDSCKGTLKLTREDLEQIYCLEKRWHN